MNYFKSCILPININLVLIVWGLLVVEVILLIFDIVCFDFLDLEIARLLEIEGARDTDRSFNWVAVFFMN
jgi:uncharacterized membrane protein